MKSIFTAIAVSSIVLGAGLSASANASASTRDITASILGLGSELVYQSAPGCARNPPPSQCKIIPAPFPPHSDSRD